MASLLRSNLPSETVAEQSSAAAVPVSLLTAATAPAPAGATSTVGDLVHEHKHEDDRDHSDGVCAELPLFENTQADEGAIAGGVGISAGTPLVAFAHTFQLSSNPTASKTMALTLQDSGGCAVGTTAPVVGTILNDDRPTVTLALSPTSVSEGGCANLVYTFTRSVATADPLTVSYSVGGTATVGLDYTGIASGSGNRTVTIVGGAASAQLIVDPSDDDSNPAPTAGADTLIFTPSLDTLTGLGGADTFQLIDLKNSLFVSGTTVDKVTSLVTTEDRFDSPFRTTALAPTAAGSVSALSASGIANRLITSRFTANGAATFTFGSGSSLRTFLGINDNVAGYQAANDAIIEITGYSGLLTSLRVL